MGKEINTENQTEFPWEFPFQSLGLITAEVFGRVRCEVANSDRHAISTA